ncbi:MAG: N-acetylmuramoyl-L-alanine amidase [Lachnospiraceae bacterium]|jgi:hypothetical protein|nr:N-acetylmuramoyl-L-alanine amidase [Lachnospiraceae bacterium]
MLRQNNNAWRSVDYEEVHDRRNPYLVDYEEQRRHGRRGADGTGRRGGSSDDRRRALDRRNIVPMTERRGGSYGAGAIRDDQWNSQDSHLDAEDVADRLTMLYGSGEVRHSASNRNTASADHRRAAYKGENGIRQSRAETSARTEQRRYRPASRERSFDNRPGPRRYEEEAGCISTDRISGSSGRRQAAVQDSRPERAGRSMAQVTGASCRAGYPDAAPCRAGYRNAAPRREIVCEREAVSYRSGGRHSSAHARAIRRKKAAMQRLMIAVWALCVFTLIAAIFLRKFWQNETEPGAATGAPAVSGADGAMGRGSGERVQGLPAEVFARHPDWEENFLTPNEYSRPGEALESITNIFVHYTANPGTSAAQNRSYFEQQKDTHEVSVSAHFIIGYEGEIIQCVPLDEIAYAVMTRNYDSISIECCYLEEDGSFTQETYDSLISLLSWLTDAYGLDTEDILRHYDCGGKKCPLYYTEHEDAWEQLKKDVDKL